MIIIIHLRYQGETIQTVRTRLKLVHAPAREIALDIDKAVRQALPNPINLKQK